MNRGIMFVRDPVAMAKKAAPFLSFDHDPYAVIDNGHIDWVVDGYTTTANYPYSQNASSQQVAIGSTLPGNYNYVRNSVKVIIDADSGQMTFYDVDPERPHHSGVRVGVPPHVHAALEDEPAAPGPPAVSPDIFSIQSAIFGRYHLTNPQAFYAASNAWQLSPTAGAGPQSQALLAENTYNSQGQLVSTTPARMAPQYQVYALPGTTQPIFTISTGFVPTSQSSSVSGSNQNFNMTAWMVGQSDPGTYGQLNVYETPQGTNGPANADAEISANKTVSSDITLLDQKGTEVLLGETLDGPDRGLHGVPAAVVRRFYDESAAEPAVRRRGVGEERADRLLAVGRALRRAPRDGVRSQRKRQLVERCRACGGGRVPQRGADGLHQHARRAEQQNLRRVPDGHPGNAATDCAGPTIAELDGCSDRVDHHDDDGAGGEEGKVHQAEPRPRRAPRR